MLTGAAFKKKVFLFELCHEKTYFLLMQNKGVDQLRGQLISTFLVFAI